MDNNNSTGTSTVNQNKGNSDGERATAASSFGNGASIVAAATPSSVSQVSPLTRFRERLKQNFTSLAKIRKRLLLLFIFSLLSALLFVFYWSAIHFYLEEHQVLSYWMNNLSVVFLGLSVSLFVLLLYLRFANFKISNSSKFEKQLNKDLEMYNMAFSPHASSLYVCIVGPASGQKSRKSAEDGLSFSRKIPKKWQDIFYLYRDEFFRRKNYYHNTDPLKKTN